MNPAFWQACLLMFATLPFSGRAGALPPDPWQEHFDFRLLLGSLDGAESEAPLRHDSHRYTVGFGASSALGGHDWLEANLEAWVTERGYAATVTAGGGATDTLTFQAAALAYGLRLRGTTRLRPYASLAAGFQASRLHARVLGGAPDLKVQEDTLEPTLHLGLGVEWQAGRDLFALDWRRWYAQGDFSTFAAREVDLGGDYLGISLGHRW
jgi:hypothetical protein